MALLERPPKGPQKAFCRRIFRPCVARQNLSLCRLLDKYNITQTHIWESHGFLLHWNVKLDLSTPLLNKEKPFFSPPVWLALIAENKYDNKQKSTLLEKLLNILSRSFYPAWAGLQEDGKASSCLTSRPLLHAGVNRNVRAAWSLTAFMLHSSRGCVHLNGEGWKMKKNKLFVFKNASCVNEQLWKQASLLLP